MTVHTSSRAKPGFARLGALVLAALCSLALFVRPAQAAEWMDPYLDQVVEWGVMRGDAAGNLNPNRQITRAEFVTMVNRAFGYTKMSDGNPFRDITPSDWFYDDILIAHEVGYFNGTSDRTASPYNLVTREQAAVMLGRSLRFQGDPGTHTDFADDTEMGPWSRGLVQEAAGMGIIQGYSDGTFRPKQLITRGQMACFLVRALGTLVQETGEQTSGGVYGNLTINTPGVKLKDTVVTGNLYLTGGVGLGGVELENVTVMGKIVICGGGEAEGGQNSIILRNVTADALELDSLDEEQFISLQAEGLTSINNTTVRSSAFLQDLTDDGLGLQTITLDALEGAEFQLAGNIKNVLNLTPESTLQMAQGVAANVTIDESAIDAAVTIDDRASIKTLNLDRGVNVTGKGSISHVNINSAGSTVEMLPDTLTIRPGITANVDRENMDTNTAAESSEDPRILSGYPVARNVGPTSAEGVFSTNKRGTIYWGLSAMMDGSLSEEQLLNPGLNSSRIVRSGTLNATASNTEFTARLTGLTREGSYYLSAILVDSRGRKSPVKVTSFTTPDDSVPAFAPGYPTALLTEDSEGTQVVQASVMTTKDCQLYYVLLPNGSTAPTAADFRSAAIPGSLGFGVVDMKKNVPQLISRINTSYLEEQTTYSLYFWLNDADNGRSSAVRRLQITTLDKTPPTITHLTLTGTAARSATFTFALDEPGTLYWAVVKHSDKADNFYAPINGKPGGPLPKPEDLIAKIQVENGTNALRRGQANAARAATDVRFNVTGLDPQTHYDLYYVAKDRAGNYNVYTKELTPPMEFSTLDNEPPTVHQEFTHDGTDEGQTKPTPYPDTSIQLVFSESVQGIRDENGQTIHSIFAELYQEVRDASEAERAAKEEAFAKGLREHIKLWQRPVSGQPVQVVERSAANENEVGDNWVIDYRKAQVETDPDTGEMIITFPYNSVLSKSGINLDSGVTYYFTLEGIADTSQAENTMKGNRGVVTLPDFTTIDAQLIFSQGSASGDLDGEKRIFDMNFRLSPVTTANVSADTVWDMLFWSENAMTFELYSRKISGGGWSLLGSASFNPTSLTRRVGISISRQMLTSQGADTINFEPLQNMNGDREYGIIVTELNGNKNRAEWSGTGSITIVPVAGDQGSMTVLANSNLTPDNYKAHQQGIYAVKEIGVPTEYTVSCPFRDTNPPTFVDGYPTFEAGDTGVNMSIMLNRSGRYYYVIAPVGFVPTTVTSNGKPISSSNPADTSVTSTSGWDSLPVNGNDFDGRKDPTVNGNASLPSSGTITNPNFKGDSFRTGSGNSDGSYTNIPITELTPNTNYVAYFVLQGESAESVSNVYAFAFNTSEADRPILQAQLSNPRVTVTSLAPTNTDTPKDARVSYMVINSVMPNSILNGKMSNNWNADAAQKYNLSDSTISTYQNYTLIEAMSVMYRANGEVKGSVFDLFATESIQGQVASWFTSAQTNGNNILAVGIDSFTLNRGNKWTNDQLDFRKELTGNSGQYWFVAMGVSAISETRYAFTSARYLTNPAVTHPMVTAVDFNYDRNQSPSQPTAGEAENQSYTGTLTITFNGPLYYVNPQNNKLLQVVDTSDPGITQVGDYIRSSEICSPQIPVVQLVPKQNDTTPSYCTQLRFSVTNGFIRANVQFGQYLANSAGDYGEETLSLSMKVERNSNGLYEAVFTVDTAGWTV